MAKRRRKKGQPSKQQVDEKSKNFGILLAVILGVILLIFIILNNI